MSTDHLNEHHQAFIEAIQRGSKIDAIKHYRLWKNVGFKEASDHINSGWSDLVLLNLPSDDPQAIPGLASTLQEMATNPELAEVNEMLDNHLESMMPHKALDKHVEARSSSQQGLSLAITRCMNYLPKHLYEDLLKQAGFPEGSYPYRIHPGGLRIFVEHVYPPIPVRKFDWCAHYDDEEGPTGEGSTPYMAILDLINNASPTERVKE